MNDARQAHGSDDHAFDGQAPGDARKAQAPIKGRGAASYVTGRYEKTVRHGEDDGWGSVYDQALVEAKPMRCRSWRRRSPRSARGASSAATTRPTSASANR